jgi:hypothetical protein
MRRVRVSFHVEVPEVSGTERQLEEWLRFTFGDNGIIESGNPYMDAAGDYAEPVFGTFTWSIV